jgi:hypothetical protein
MNFLLYILILNGKLSFGKFMLDKVTVGGCDTVLWFCAVLRSGKSINSFFKEGEFGSDD